MINMIIEGQFVKGKGFFGVIDEIYHQHDAACVRVHNGIKWTNSIKPISKLTAIGMEEFSQLSKKKGITAQP